MKERRCEMRGIRENAPECKLSAKTFEEWKGEEEFLRDDAFGRDVYCRLLKNIKRKRRNL